MNHKRKELAQQKKISNRQKQLQEIEAQPPTRSLIQQIRTFPHFPVIAELKKASPSAGVIRKDFDVIAIGQSYQKNGAAALSVLTDEHFFGGSLNFIRQLRPLIDLPILRKDFIFDEYQLLEARAAGADAVLLIVAALERSQLIELLQAASALGLEALVEIHTREELETALESGAKLIGINNRSLHTFAIDLATTEKLAPLVPKDITLVGESGVETAGDIRRLQTAGVHALLIGSSLMKKTDPGVGLKTLFNFSQSSLPDKQHL
jgi:indole-3-glycerol phosphate synthase